MSRKWQIAFFWILVLVGGILHVVFWLKKTGMHYPDEIFQYLEPAFIKLKGFGWLPWEFDRGVRNWTLIAFYGGWMKVFLFFGADGAWLHRLIGLHNALVALVAFPATLRMGRNYGGETGGLTAAALTALFPPLLFFTPHPLSEVPSMVLSTWGIAFWLQGRGSTDERKFALLSGLFLGLATVVRFFAAVFILVPLFDYAVRLFHRRRGIFYFAGGGLIASFLLGITDWITWGKPFHSAIEYFRYNILEWGNVDHGVSPWWQYLRWFTERMGWGLIVALPLFLVGVWRARLIFLTSFVALLSLSLIAHKEERFVLALWPLLLVIFAAGVSHFGRWFASWVGRCLVPFAAVTLSAVILVFSSLGTARLEWHWLGDLFEAQQFVGKQSDLTGCMFSGRLHLSGGSSYINKNVPLDSYQSDLSRNPLFNYFILKDGSFEATLARSRKWTALARFGEFVVFHRPY